MLTIFIDISDIRVLFMATRDPETGISRILTENDFKIWLFEAVNFLNLIYTDFALATDNVKNRLSAAVSQFDGLGLLHETLASSLNHELLAEKTIYSSYGYVYGDLLYFQLEVSDNE